MKDEQLALFQELTEANGAPGFEGPVREKMKSHLERYSDRLVFDRLGGVFGVKEGPSDAPKVLVAGHMDEVAFMVTQITEKGFIKFQPLGGWWDQVLLAQRVQIMTGQGVIPGVIGSTPPHLLDEDARKKPVQIKQMFIDVGADSREEAEAMGVKPGQPILPATPFTVLAGGKKLLAKAWDNRYGCALAIELMRALQGETLQVNLYSGATVQEEVGLRGAAVAANLVEPDLFFALDAGPAGDTPGVRDGFGRLGDGVLIRIYDRSMILLPGLRDLILDVAEAEKIPYQFFVSQGGTDAGRMHLSGKGVPSAVISIPARYIHSHVSVIHRDDYQAAKQLLTALIRKLNPALIKEIQASQTL